MKLIRYLKPYWFWALLTPLTMIGEVIADLLQPKLMSVLVNEGVLQNDQSLLISVGLRMLLIVALGGLAGTSCGVFASLASQNFACDLRKDVFKSAMSLSFQQTDKFTTGSLITRLTNDITQMQNFVNALLRMALRAPGMMISALIMAIAMNPPLSVVLAVCVPMMLAFIGIIIKVSFPRFSAKQKKLDALNSTVQENITNVRVIKSFVRQSYETDKFETANRDLKDTSMAAMKIMIFMHPVMTLFMNAAVLAVILLGGKFVLTGNMPIGDLSAFITYVTQILSSLMAVTMLLMSTSRAMASAKRIREVMEEPIDLSDDTAAYPDLGVSRGQVEFKNVTFRYYKNSEDAVLSDVNLTIPAGATIGIIGSTGCGKTTLVSMIPRLYDVDEGEVLIDG
ncbi:MAG: ABC transporter ATP-binding protein, partial [Clostridia bacterium]|nr:ABC transporter ATP-binding protein [Clostridia bacterium]